MSASYFHMCMSRSYRVTSYKQIFSAVEVVVSCSSNLHLLLLQLWISVTANHRAPERRTQTKEGKNFLQKIRVSQIASP
ncbi:hypothetical protein EB796_006022 [Bugula neritina]|uniref:Uncharacterized protein n=1 Tax=Bugula neritina TaxID=10212 RepID=A0A7J7KDP9_BUGNE|nr:hypothetical protein EB796_006022 [Bugula neritina]